MSTEYGPLTLALLLSLLIHTLLLSLIFGGQGLWPGFGFPWQARRVEAPNLRVVVVPAQVTALEPAVTPVPEPQQASAGQPVAGGPALAPPSVSIVRRTATAITPEANPTAEANPKAKGVSVAAPAQMPLRADRPADTPLPLIPSPAVIALTPIDEATLLVPATPAIPTPVIVATPSVPIPETAPPPLRNAGDAAQARIDQQAPERAVELAKLDLPKQDPSEQERRRQAEQLETARQDAGRQEAARAKSARQAAEQQEAARQEAALKEATRIEAAKTEAAKVEAAKVEAAKVEAAKVEAARVEAARVEAVKVEAAKVEAARAEATRTEAARIQAANAEAARAEATRAEAAKAEAARVETARIEAARAEGVKVDAAQEAAARREATLRAIGRQLDEEAARREAARQLPSSSNARRYRLFGRTDPNADLILYAEAWARKIQLNMTFDLVREAAKQPHTDPVVTVAIRSDGSVESVTFVKSSGVAALDEAIRRVVQSQTPYQEFPAGLAREFDVIEIRRTWYFDVAIRLY